MTPQERLALALQYQKQRDLGSALPSTPAENAARPVQEPEQSWLDKLSEAASGVGYGLGQQVEGLGQMARHPLDTLHSIAVGAGKAMDNPSAAAQAAWEGLKQSAGEAVSSPFNLGQAVGANVNISPRKLAAMLESPAVREIVAYHGTPHRFEPTEANPLGEFDASKIGEGLGQQIYGHGIYFAESPNVAKRFVKESYDTNKGTITHLNLVKNLLDESGDIPKKLKSSFESKANQSLLDITINNKNGFEVAKQIENSKDADMYAGLASALKKLNPERSKGSLYKTEIPDEMIANMLDWNKPVNDQPAVLSAIKNIPEIKNLIEANENVNNLTGANLYKLIAESNPEGRKYSSDVLQSVGIPGIKYLNTSNLNAENANTKNFIVFPGEEKKVKILERK